MGIKDRIVTKLEKPAAKANIVALGAFLLSLAAFIIAIGFAMTAHTVKVTDAN